MKVSQREKFISIGAAVVVTLFVLDSFALSPWFARLSKADATIADQKQWLSEAEQAYRGSEHAARRWREMSREVLKADAPAAESQVLNAARQWAQASGLSLTSLKPERSEKEQGFMKITIRATAAGTMSQIARFIHTAQESKFPVRISDLLISTHKEGTDDLTVQIGLATIYQPAVVQQPTTETVR